MLYEVITHLGGGVLHAGDRAARAVLDGLDHISHLAGGLHGLLREFAHLVGHHREAPAALAGTGRLDGRIERQEIGLAGDLLDAGGDRSDLLRLLRQTTEYRRQQRGLFDQLLRRPTGVDNGRFDGIHLAGGFARDGPGLIAEVV